MNQSLSSKDSFTIITLMDYFSEQIKTYNHKSNKLNLTLPLFPFSIELSFILNQYFGRSWSFIWKVEKGEDT